MSNVSIVIVTYNSEATIGSCLESIPRGVETIVVDSGSHDETAEAIARFPSVRFIQSENRGFGAGCNLGASQAHGDYLLLLNPDAALAENAIETMLQCLQSHPNAGMVGPKIFSADGLVELSWGEKPSLLSELKRKQEHRNPPRIPASCTKVDWVSGACLLLATETWQSLEGFDEGYFLYFEDVDLCWRLVKTKREVLFEPRAAIHHLRGHSSRQIALQTEIWYRQSQRRFYRKHSSWVQSLLLWCYLVLKYAPKALFGSLQARAILANALLLI